MLDKLDLIFTGQLCQILDKLEKFDQIIVAG